tara:strand:- start:37 stop:840 length:804 start_codon:yes stop_codon:yes gene_type:complete
VATYLDKILDFHRERSQDDVRSLDALVEKTTEFEPTRGFGKSLLDTPDDEVAVIAEIKRRSPSLGMLLENLTPSELGREYEQGGASALSVLTDEKHFDGSSVDLQEAREATSLPVLRKDFTVDLRDICDARIMGADAVLLIVAALDDYELKDFLALSNELNLDALVEVHDEREVDRALGIEAKIIGVNQRDLQTFEVDTKRALRIGALLPEGVIKVAESGIKSPADIEELLSVNYEAVLVGEYLVRSENRSRQVAELRRAVIEEDRQ